VARLTRFREKFKALALTGIDHVLILPFTPAFSQLEAEDFIKKVLQEGLGVNRIIVGDDFRFGREEKAMLSF